MLSDVRCVACVGAGVVGAGWAVVFARAGLEVHVYDEDPARLAALGVKGNVRVFDDLAEALTGVTYVQESVPEQLELKRRVFGELDRLAAFEAILASSASTHCMTDIARDMARPERCLVVHPFNPPYALPLVEIVPGERTDAALPEAVAAFMEAVGQRPITCRREIFGFVGNRLQMALLREALHLLREGVASMEDIDRCVTDGIGLRWALLGPFAVEHTNAASIEEDLRKFRATLQALFDSLHHGTDLLGDGDIEAIVGEAERAFAGRPHVELLAWRDRKLVELREARDR